MNHPTSPAPEVDVPRRGGFHLRASGNTLARAVAWAVVRTLIGLLAAGLLVCYLYTTG